MTKPVSGTKEWAKSTVNVMSGCANGCLYCYARADAIRYGRKTPDNWEDEEVNLKVVGKRFGKRQGRVMFPTTHDLTRGNIVHCRKVLGEIVAADNMVLVVSKPDPWVIEWLCDYLTHTPDLDLFPPNPQQKILFRFTIGSNDSRTLKFWEPHAPSYEERLYALMWAHKNGWLTSVSMEPLLSTELDAVVQQVAAMSPYVTDAIWIGRMNNPAARIKMNLGRMPDRVAVVLKQLLDSQNDERIWELYNRLKDNTKVRWKESIKKVVGLELATEAGLDR